MQCLLHAAKIHILADSKDLSVSLSKFPDKTQNRFRCHFYSSLHIHTKTNPHKVSNITQRYFQKCCYQKLSVEYSQRTPCLLLLISALFSVGECLVEGDGEGDEWSGRGSTLCCVWAPEPPVTGHCQVGSAAGPACDLTRNAAILSVVKGFETLWKKSKCLCRKTQMGPMGNFSLPCFGLVGRFKAAVQIPSDSTCHAGCDWRCFSSLSLHLPFY